jgi:hypothetical protein
MWLSRNPVLLSIISPLKRGGLHLVEVYDRLGDRLSGQAIAKVVKRAVSRLRSREGSIIRVIGGKRFVPKAAVFLAF